MEENGVRGFRDLIVWQKSMDFAEHVYAVQRTFPVEERFGSGDQSRRAVVSMPSNIAEGKGRGSAKDFANFLNLARGSLNEVMTQVESARRFGYLESDAELQAEAETIGKMLNSLMRNLRRSLLRSPAKPPASEPTNLLTNLPTYPPAHLTT